MNPWTYLAGLFLALEGAFSMAANPEDPPSYQLGRLSRIFIGVALMSEGGK